MTRGPTPAVELSAVRAGYGGIDVLHGVDLTAHFGRVLALLGPNGGGKSTLLGTVAGLVGCSAGEVRIAGTVATGVTTRRRARTGVCLIPEGRGVFPNLTVRENLWMMAHGRGDRARVEATCFERLPALGRRRSQLAGTLSGGEQQMLAVARALVTDPAVLLIDELSMGLAPIIVAELFELVSTIAGQGVAVIIVEQFAQAVLRFADDAAVLVRGRIVHQGTPQQIEPLLATAYLGAATT